MAYSRYIVAPRSFYKTWLSHIDAYPLFVANAAGCALVMYFGYRKMYKHPDNRWQTGNVLSPEADGSFDETAIEKASDWLRWMRQFEHKTASFNELLFATTNWTSTTDKQKAELAWNRSEISYTPSNDAEEYKNILTTFIEPSYLQKMVAMEEVDADEIQQPGEVELENPMLETVKNLTEEQEVHILNLLGKHADVLDLEYQVAVSHSELPDKSDMVRNFCKKLKSYSNDSVYTPGSLMELVKDSKVSPALCDAIEKELSSITN